MKLEVGGKQYGNFLAASATLRLDALTNTFSFAASSKNAKPLPFRGGESCKVYVGGELVITGSIELVNVEGDASAHSIDIQGRDLTGDLLDSSIGGPGPPPLSDIKPPISLARICEIVIANIGSTIKVIDMVKPPLFDKAFDQIAPEPGDNAFDFLESKARRKQVFLTSDFDGNLVIVGPAGIDSGAYIQNKIGDPNLANNVLSYSVSYDDTGRFNLYRSISQLNLIAASGKGGISTSSAIVSQGEASVIRDADIRKGRQFILVSESMFPGSGDRDRISWEQKIRQARGRVYSAKVDGFRDHNGNLWALNTLVQVNDDPAGINAKMLVNTIDFSMSNDEGRTSTLTFVERNAYTLSAAEPIAEGLGIGLLS